MNGGFCTSCGIKIEGNIKLSDHDGSRYLVCGCGYEMRFYILHTQTKTGTEVRKEFQDTKLTHKQQFG